MATFLFDEIIFGPVQSRRLGVSLGINLLPQGIKLCNYNCIYCECGWTKDTGEMKPGFPSSALVREKLESKLMRMKEDQWSPDSITFAGNGEPTLHPEFPLIIDQTLTLRDRLFPKATVAVLSNGSRIRNAEVFQALCRVDDNILKLDSAINETNLLLNQPRFGFSVEEYILDLMKFGGNFVLQTMFVKGEINGQEFDNTSEREVRAWLSVVEKLHPRKVMIYTIARDTPTSGILRIEKEKLDEIAGWVKQLGIPVSVSA
jgi:wyosine [tRNA(Phe)-imidazoG37] synthetase (radical SAM superfamily)